MIYSLGSAPAVSVFQKLWNGPFCVPALPYTSLILGNSLLPRLCWAVIGMSGNRHKPSGLLSVQLVGSATQSTSRKRFVAKKQKQKQIELLST